MVINYEDIITKISKTTTLLGIKTVKGSDGKDFFPDEDKHKFIHSLLDEDISKKTENTKATAILLVKVKKAYLTKAKDVGLLKDLEEERSKKSIAYRVLNYKNEFVDAAIDRLRYIEQSKEIPKGKDAIEARIREIEIEIGKLKGEQAKKNIQRRNHLASLIERKKKIKEAEDTIRKKENLLKVLSSIVDGTDGDIFLDKKDADGNWETKKLSAFTGLEINDYSGEGLLETKPGTEIPLDITIGKTSKTITGNALELFSSHGEGNAKKFLEDITSLMISEYPVYFKNTLDESYGERYYTSKGNLLDYRGAYGVSFLTVLRDIGAENLKKAVRETSYSASDKKELEKIAEDITEFIMTTEVINGIGFVSRDHTAVEKQKKYDAWHETILSKKVNEYPYQPKPN